MSDSVADLIDTLRSLGGEYFHPSYQPLSWVLSEEQAPVFHRIDAMGDAAIAPLVQCIGDTAKTLTRIQQRTVSLGVLCFEALNRLIYHEEPSINGDIDLDWPGYVTPEDTGVDLRRARKAWQKVVHDGTFQRNLKSSHK
jgi:hypothetical protein